MFKGLIFAFVFVILFGDCFCQSITVGDTTAGGIYYKRVDTTFNWYSSGDAFRIDVDFDNIKDFLVKSDTQTIFSTNPGPPLGYWSRLAAYSSSTTNATEAVFATASPYVKIFSVGNVINAAENYTPASAPSPYFRAISWRMLYNMNFTNGGTTGTDIYIGFRKINLNDTIYGWMRMDNSTSNVTIKSYAFTVKSLNVQENSHSNFRISLVPNPVNDFVSITIGGDVVLPDNIVVKDLLGNNVLSKNGGLSKNCQLNVGELSSGIYFVSIVSNGTVVNTQKFVKQ